jgi:ubiquinone/menaquinone biosynthesis C-methylase UbiE
MRDVIEVWVETVPGLREKLEAGCDVLDLECGFGEIAIAIKERFPKARVVGFDRAPVNIGVARAVARARGVTGIQFTRIDWSLATIYGFAVVFTSAGRVSSAEKPDLVRAVERSLRSNGVHVEVDGLWPANHASGQAA